MTRMTPRIPLIALLVAGCADNGAVPAADRRATLTEELRLDAYAENLVPIQALAVAEDGTIAVGQTQDGTIRFFSDTGEPLGSVGRQGQGPGEFTAISALGWVADTLWAYDIRQQRAGLISPARAFVRHVPVPRPIRPPPGDESAIPTYLSASANGLLPDGTMIVMAQSYETGGGPMDSGDHASIARVSEEGEIIHLLHRISTVGLQVVTARAEMTMPFANVPSIATSPDGSRTAVATASLDGVDEGTFRVTVVDAAGDTVIDRRYPFPGVPLPQAVFDSVVSTAESFAARDPELVAAIRRQTPRRSVYPPLTRIIIGRDGTVFVQMHADAGVAPVRVIGADGDPLGWLSLPERSRVAVGEGDRIWVIERDEVDVETVVRYAVEWE